MPDSSSASIAEGRFFWVFIACFALQCAALLSTLLVGYLANVTGRRNAANTVSAFSLESAAAESAIAKQEVATLSGKVESAISEQERLRQENSDLTKKLEDERLIRRKIEQRLAPRKVTAQQAKILHENLDKFSGTKITIVTSTTDGESRAFAKQISDLLESAGWTTTVLTSVAADLIHSGVAVESPRGTDVEAASSLYDALKTAGIHVETTSAARIYGDSVLLLVGCKPQ